MATENNTSTGTRPRLLKLHLAIHVIVSGAAVGGLVHAMRPLLSYPAAVSILFWLFTIVLYPAAAIFVETRGSEWIGPRPFMRWLVQFTTAAGVMFLVTRYFGPR